MDGGLTEVKRSLVAVLAGVAADLPTVPAGVDAAERSPGVGCHHGKREKAESVGFHRGKFRKMLTV